MPFLKSYVRKLTLESYSRNANLHSVRLSSKLTYKRLATDDYTKVQSSLSKVSYILYFIYHI